MAKLKERCQRASIGFNLDKVYAYLLWYEIVQLSVIVYLFETFCQKGTIIC